jgi:multiple sugar transport system permease protein
LKTKLKGVSYAKWGYIFSIPFIVTFLLFSLYPTFYTLLLGFTDCIGLNNTEWKFLEHPFDNFKTIFENNSFKKSLKNTVLIWVLNFTPQITMALLLSAIFTSHRNEIKGKGFFKVVFYMPNIITAASVAVLFNAIFSYPVGPANDLLISFGFRDEPYNFLVYKTPAQLIVAFIQFLTWYGNTMIVLISGILGISPDIYEAAEIDGSNGWQTFWQITVPNLKTVLLYTLITSLVGGLNMYDIPKLFNEGGPDGATLTTSVFIANQAFSGRYLYNRAAAASMILFALISVLSAVLFWLMRDKDEAKIEKEKRDARRAAKKQQKEAIKWQ